MVLDEATWALIRQLWSDTSEPARQIAVRYEVAQSTICRRAAREGWARHPDRAAPSSRPRADRSRPTGSRASASPAPGLLATRLCDLGSDRSIPPPKRDGRSQPREPAHPEERVRRMLAIIDLQLEQLEKDMTSSDELTVQDKERLGRQFAGAIGSLEKVMEVASEHEKARAKRDGTSAAGDRSADDLRHEIAERLDRLNAQWLAHERPR